MEIFKDEFLNNGLFRNTRQGIIYRTFIIANGREMTSGEAVELGMSPASYYRHKKEYAENPTLDKIVKEAQFKVLQEELGK